MRAIAIKILYTLLGACVSIEIFFLILFFSDRLFFKYYYDTLALAGLYFAIATGLALLVLHRDTLLAHLQKIRRHPNVQAWFPAIQLIFFFSAAYLLLYAFFPDAWRPALRLWNIFVIILTWVSGTFVFLDINPEADDSEKKLSSKSITQHPWFYPGVLAMLIIVGAVLRTIHLGALGFSTDEGSTALYSMLINQTGIPCDAGICYLRGLPYLYLVSLFTGLFGVTEFWVRFPGVFITMATIPFIYILIRLIHPKKWVALLASTFILFADWHFMLGRYARMYNLFFFFVVIALFSYIKTFYQHKKGYVVLLLLSCALAILTHQFGILLLFFLVEPLLTNRSYLYKEPLYCIFAFILLIISVLALTKLPGIIYTHDQYISYYELYPNNFVSSKYWYLNFFQNPDLTYIKKLFRFFPAMVGIVAAFITASLLNRKDQRIHMLQLFAVGVFGVFMIYKIDYALKYLWWILPILYCIVALAFARLSTRYPKSAIVGIVLFIAIHVGGIHHILTRNYGQNETTHPMLMSSHVEEYHPDDKTPVEYVVEHYKEGDTIITDYWMQDVYLQMLTGHKSNYFINRWDVKEFLQKFPYYQLYYDAPNWRMNANGPITISSVDAVQQAIDENTTGNVWYISSVDFEHKEYLYISKKSVQSYIQRNYKESVQYTGKDGHSKVYRLKKKRVE